MKYTREEAFNATLEYFNGNEMLTNIWLSKYCLRNKAGEYLELTPDDRFRTIAKIVGKYDLKIHPDAVSSDFEGIVYDMIKDFGRFIPGGSILYGIGNDEYLSSLGNCFVIGNKVDSYGSICLIDQEQVQLMKRRGGVGHDLSHLRPKFSPVNGCAASSTGAFSFAPRYSSSTREVAQDGRRGALMLSAHINHPDIEDFITLKDDLTSCTGANISVKVTDEFMENVECGGEHISRFPIDSDNYVSEKPARDIFRKIVHQAWKNGEPGLLFWDTILRESPADCYADEGFETISTNPCGEIPLSPYDSCRLGHCNLYSYVKDPFTDHASFDWNALKRDAAYFQRFMDIAIDIEIEKINGIIEQVESSYEDEETKRVELNLWKKVKSTALKGRRTGIGILGEGDTLAAMGMRYSSPEGNEFLVKVHKTFAIACYTESINLAKEKGAFPIFDASKEEDHPFITRILDELDQETLSNYYKYGRRNIACLTLAPTGTVSQFANRRGTTSGMEPVFEVSYKRRRKVNASDKNANITFVDENGDAYEEYRVFHPNFKTWYDIAIKGTDLENTYPADLESYSDDLLKELIKISPYKDSTANEVDVISKIHLQGNIQKWVDHSISVTHNLPYSTTENDIYNYYMEAWRAGCKGVTVYRDGSRSGVLVRNDNTPSNFSYSDAVKRPKSLPCDIHKITALKEKWVVIVGLLNDHPYEIFAIKEDKFPVELPSKVVKGTVTKKKKRWYDVDITWSDGNTVSISNIVSLMENDDDRADTRHFSLDLRHRIDPRWIIEMFDKQAKAITSFEKAISRVLKTYIEDGEKSGMICPNCGSTNMIYSSGCPLCKDCGYSKCG